MARASKQHLTIDGRNVPVSNLDKIFFPRGRVTKAQVIDYYLRVATHLLPHLRNRPVTLKRYPNGVLGEFFYEKDAPSFTPDWVETFPVPRRESAGSIRYILVNDRATLVWLANLANLEIHPFLHRVPDIDRPTSIVFDLDPGEGADVLTCGRVAFLLRDLLSDLRLQSFVKVSGSKGLQIHAPLNTDITYDLTQPFAKAVAELLSQQHPKLVVPEMAKALRRRKVFIDWSQNADFKTTVGVYSLRAKTNEPFVSLPVTWNELETAVTKGNADDLFFGIDAALARLEEFGDLFKSVLSLKQELPSSVLKHLEARMPRSLAKYEAKRDFRKTSEPAAAPVRRSRQGSRRRFVIQKHAASHLHYDFRLEMHDVLKSWAVPKGPPYAEGEKRLAMPTEDHPLEYLEFEGIIPKGQYGGGTVMVWDIGTYEVIDGNYYKGYLRVHLNGRKLKGEWELVRQPRKGERDSWQLIKAGKSMRAVSKKRDDASALSGRPMEQIAQAADATWQSNRANDLPKAKLTFIEPMLANLVHELPAGPEWQYELKLDGYRAVGAKTKGTVTLYSRRGNKLNSRFPSIVQALAKLPADTMVDGEIIALDDTGRPSFATLQNVQSIPAESLRFYLFDVLASQGQDVRGLPLSERRNLLESAAANLEVPIVLSEVFDTSPEQLIRATKKAGLEGIVAKRRDSKYEAGARSASWVKYKTDNAQEFVVGGYKPGKYGFEYLLAGYYEGRDLIFVAKIKNGFVPHLRREVARHFEGLETTHCPFANLPEPKNARRGEAITADVMKKIRWLKPKLVAQVAFTEWTSNNHLRHSRFIALRDDKSARDVVRETAA